MRSKASVYEREVIHDYHQIWCVLLYNQGLGKGCQVHSKNLLLKG